MTFSNPEMLSFVVVMVTEIVVVIVWLVRIEGRVKTLEHRVNEKKETIAKIEYKMEAIDSKVINELNRLREAISRIEGILSVSQPRDGHYKHD